jgi:hypothetical protein
MFTQLMKTGIAASFLVAWFALTNPAQARHEQGRTHARHSPVAEGILAPWELRKCTKGVGTKGGCFGPANTLTKAGKSALKSGKKLAKKVKW